jgi:hypothetical protein
METRYQDASWYVKLYRWLRYKPVYTALFAWDILLWILCGAKLTEDDKVWFVNRRGYIQHAWMCYMSIADSKMIHYWTLEEIIADLKAKK